MIKFDKIWEYQNAGSPSNEAKKIHFCKTHEIFRVGKYYKKIKFDKISVYQKEGFPLKRGRQNFELLND